MPPYDGSGNFTLYTPGNPRVAGTTIAVAAINNTNSDFATGLTNAITRDGQSPPTANLPMGGLRHTGVDDAVSRTDYAAAGQVADGALTYLTAVAGTNTITADATPAITAYAAGQRFAFIAANKNTSSTTININGVGAKSITKNGTTTLSGGDIPSGAAVTIVYDGSQFQLQNPRNQTGYLVTAFSANTGATTVNFLPSGLSAIAYSEIVVMFEGVSISGTDDILLQLIDDLGTLTSGYFSRAVTFNGATSQTSGSSAGFIIPAGSGTAALSGELTLRREKTAALPGGDKWHIFGGMPNSVGSNGSIITMGNGSLNSATPAKVLDGLRLITTGANTFDAGTIYVTGRT